MVLTSHNTSLIATIHHNIDKLQVGIWNCSINKPKWLVHKSSFWGAFLQLFSDGCLLLSLKLNLICKLRSISSGIFLVDHACKIWIMKTKMKIHTDNPEELQSLKPVVCKALKTFLISLQSLKYKNFLQKESCTAFLQQIAAT